VDQIVRLLSRSKERKVSTELPLLQPIVKQLVTYLEVEWLWLEALKIVEARLKKSLGRARSMAKRRCVFDCRALLPQNRDLIGSHFSPLLD
jgi:hypothetical protein